MNHGDLQEGEKVPSELIAQLETQWKEKSVDRHCLEEFLHSRKYHFNFLERERKRREEAEQKRRQESGGREGFSITG